MAPTTAGENSNQRFLTRAARTAGKNIQKGHGGPFGAVITKKGKIISVACNSVLKNQDPTCHAEINAIRLAAKKQKSFSLVGCSIYSTTEPCPMCFSAIHWARIKNIFYSTTIAEVKKLGFNELSVSNAQLKKWGKSRTNIFRLDNEACRELLKKWKQLPRKKIY